MNIDGYHSKDSSTKFSDLKIDMGFSDCMKKLNNNSSNYDWNIHHLSITGMQYQHFSIIQESGSIQGEYLPQLILDFSSQESFIQRKLNIRDAFIGNDSIQVNQEEDTNYFYSQNHFFHHDMMVSLSNTLNDNITIDGLTPSIQIDGKNVVTEESS